MAGRPKLHGDIALLNDRAADVEALLADGKAQKAVWEAMGVSRSAWDRFLGSERGAALLARARSAAASTLAEETMGLVDGVKEDKDAINKVKLQVDNRRWLAGVWDKNYLPPQQQGGNVTVNVNSLHLGALRHTTAAEPPQALPHEVEDAEWCDVEEPDDTWLDG